MANTITVDIRALTGTFQTDMKRAEKSARDAFKNIEQDAKRLGAAFGAFAVAGAAALSALTAKSISAAGALSEMSQKVGASVESLSTLGFAAEQSGVGIDQLQSAMVKLAKNASDASQGIGTAKDAFEALGIEVTKADGSLKDTDTLLKQVATELDKYRDGANKTALAVAIFGRAGAELLPLMKGGADAIEGAQQAARDLGLELSTNTAQQAEAFGDQLDQLKSLATGLGNDIMTQVLPSLTALAQDLIDTGVEGRKAGEGTQVFANAMKGAIAFAIVLKNGVEGLTHVVAGYVDIAAAASDAVKKLALAATPAGAAMNAMNGEFNAGGAILAEFRKKAQTAFATGNEGLAANVADVTDAFEKLWPVLKDTGEGVKQAGEEAKRAAPGMQTLATQTASVAKAAKDAAKELDPFTKKIDALLREIEDSQVNKLAADMAQLQIALDMAINDGDTARAERLTQALIVLADQGFGAVSDQVAGLPDLMAEANEAAEQLAREWEGIWTNATDAVGDALTTALFDGAESGADAIKNVMENLARDLVQFWLRQNIVVPIQQQLFGGAAGAAGAASGMGGYIGAAGFGLLLGNSQASRAGGALGAAGGYWAGSLGATMATQAVAAGSLGTTLGAALGSAAPIVGTIIGAIIGQALGGLFDGSSDPRFRVADRESDARASSRLDDIIGVARDNMESGSATALANGIRDFDNAIADFLNNDELARVRDALDNWTIDVSGSAATIENVLGQRFTAIMATFPADVQAFVNGATTVEERVQRLAEALSWDDQIDAILGGLRRERDLAGMDEAARQAFLVNEQFDALAAQMTAMHATEAQLAELEEFRAEALANLTVATEAATEAMQFQEAAARDYAATVNDINRQLAEASGASEFQLSLQDIAAGLNENVRRLNETARAAGLLSAREEDLGRAHLLAAAQAARAMAQLEEAGRSLAADLYGSEMGDIEAEIARIEAESSGASSAIASFGDAIRETAEAANRATDLLLGDLSPLRDRQKLPLALQAFQRGEIQAEQVLEIGRRLMASGADYNQLFDQVLAIERSRGGAGQSIPTGGGGVQVSGSTDARLLALMERRDELEQAARDAQRFTQASDLAQIVADLAGARGEDFGSVLGNLSGGRATLEQFAADLGLDSVAAVEEYLRALQADSYGIADIAATITAGDRYIVDALREIFDYQMTVEGKPDFNGTDELTKPIRIGDATVPEAIVVAPPTEPTPGEREIGERIGDVDNRIGQMEGLLASLLQQIADNTGRFADGTEKNGSAALSWQAGAKPRSTRSELVKPGY